MTSFAAALLRVAAAALVAALAGGGATVGLLPRGAPRSERAAWAFAVGCLLLAGFPLAAWAAGVRPGWIVFGVVAIAAAALGRRFRIAAAQAPPEPGAPSGGERAFAVAAAAVAVLGAALYALRALTEPMWSNDFLAIWGLKGKTLYFTSRLPERFYRSPDLLFSHPEYPLGLPLLYAGVAFLAGGWDDHALALLFPLLQLATLAGLAGWLRRRNASPGLVLAAVAAVSWFAPLYSAFATGLAEVPLAFAALLFGSALSDAVDDAGSGAVRRVALAAALLAAWKNEGSFLAALGALLALFAKPGARRRTALAAILPAAAIRLLQLPWRSRLPLADFDFGAISLARVGEALAAAARLPDALVGAGLAGVLLLVLLGARDPAGDRMLALVLLALGAYVLLPAAAVRGPTWLVDTTLRRTASALFPLAAAGIAVRLRRAFAAGG